MEFLQGSFRARGLWQSDLLSPNLSVIMMESLSTILTRPMECLSMVLNWQKGRFWHRDMLFSVHLMILLFIVGGMEHISYLRCVSLF